MVSEIKYVDGHNIHHYVFHALHERIYTVTMHKSALRKVWILSVKCRWKTLKEWPTAWWYYVYAETHIGHDLHVTVVQIK